MSKQPPDEPPNECPEETIPPWEPKPDRVKPEVFPFGLSATQFARVQQKMLAVARSVCRHSGGSPEDAVQQALFKALYKPETKRPSSDDEDGFVAWLVTVAFFEGLTNRKFYLRQADREADADTEVANQLAVPSPIDKIEARECVERVLATFNPTDQELLRDLYLRGKTFSEVASERQLAPETVSAHGRRLWKLLCARMKALLAALWLLLTPKKAQAFVAQITPQVIPLSSAMAITVVCGVLVPSGSSFVTEPGPRLGLPLVDSEQANTAKAAAFGPSDVPEVAPEEPKGIDTATNTCSSGNMKCTTTASSVAENLIPMTFVLGVALAQVACAGSDQPPPHQPEEEVEHHIDLYEVLCLQERARGNRCPTREEWRKRVWGQ